MIHNAKGIKLSRGHKDSNVYAPNNRSSKTWTKIDRPATNK